MARVRNENKEPTRRRMKPAITPESRENQMISLAIDLAEKQLLEGTASSQVITHYLKLGSMKERLEMEKLRNENELLAAKSEAIKSAQRIEELYKKAIEDMRAYRVIEDEEASV